MFRIEYSLFVPVSNILRPFVQVLVTNMRNPVQEKKKFAAFLMAEGSFTYRLIANQLGMGPSTVHDAVFSISWAICARLYNKVMLPNSEAEITKVILGFQEIARLPYCVRVIDGLHISWNRCPREQYYEYRCYKGFESIVLFVLSAANRGILYADIGYPGALRDSTILQKSELYTLLTSDEWLCPYIPSLQIRDMEIRPYVLCDCAFTLSKML